jgi:hypothetical protein
MNMKTALLWSGGWLLVSYSAYVFGKKNYVSQPVLTVKKVFWEGGALKFVASNSWVTVDKHLLVRHLTEGDSGRLNKIDSRMWDSHVRHKHDNMVVMSVNTDLGQPSHHVTLRCGTETGSQSGGAHFASQAVMGH